MDLVDPTKNQHFVSQYEQRLNSINPGASKKNQRIFEHDLIDRRSCSTKLKSANGLLIQNSLSMHDLFSFDMLDNGEGRYNFELLFSRFESRAEIVTSALRAKIMQDGADVSCELIDFFKCRFLNFVRNPFSLKKMLNTFPGLELHQPTDPVQLKNFERVLNGRKPQQRFVCEVLGISDQEYREWLSVIFLLLFPSRGSASILDDLVGQFFSSSQYFRLILIYTYTEHACLLSDRGFSMPACGDDVMGFDFNLCSSGFVRYLFKDVDSDNDTGLSKLSARQVGLGVTTEAHHLVDELEVLKRYNMNVVYQCHRKVFCSGLEWYKG